MSMNEQPRKSELEGRQQTVKFFETLLRASTDGIVVSDAMQNIVVVNEAFCAFFGWRWRDVIETSLFVWLEQLDAGASRRWAELEQRVHREGACHDIEFQVGTKEGGRHLSVNASLLERAADEERGIIISTWRDVTERVRAEEGLRQYRDHLEELVERRGTELRQVVTEAKRLNEQLHRVNDELTREITERKRAEETIKQMAYHDDLTGLPNRRLFNDRLTLEMAHAQRSQQNLAVILLDLDHFKDINDTLGHGVGDQLLQATGERLSNLLRKGDTVARMGGDEFMMILPEIAQVEDAASVAQKILEVIRLPFVFDGHELHISTSIGIALYPEDGKDGDTLVKNADIAMYSAKEQGRDNYQRYTPAMTAKALE